MARTLRVLFALLALGVLMVALRPIMPIRNKAAAELPPAPATSGRIVVDLADSDGDAALLAIESEIGADLSWVSPGASDDIADGEVADLSAAIAALQRDPRVEAVEPEQVLEAYGWPDDPMYDKQWNLPAMGAPAGWSATPMGKGVIVAVVDTGVTQVEDLKATNVLEGKSFVPGASTARDDNGHGTHVSGTIAQSTNNGVGVAGIAPNATILPVKVLSGGGFGTSGWIASGIDYAVEQGAGVINLSLGGGYSPVIHNAIKKATKQGVIVVAAAGNSGREGVGYPGGLAETIGVSATGPGGDLAPYSSWGKGVDIAAPGGDKRQAGGGILQDTVDGKGGHAYLEYQGTSMATPHVAGAAAVLLSTGMEPEAVERTLLDTARPKQSTWFAYLGSAGTPSAAGGFPASLWGRSDWDPKYGYGSLDLQAALGNVGDTYGALRFALGAGLALIATHLGLSGRFRLIAAGVAAVTAGGLFFLPWLPIPGGVVLAVLAKPFLTWPGLLMGSQWWSGFPLWLSAALPFLVAFIPGADRKLRPWALGFVAGIGAHLLFGAVTGTLNPWLMPAGLDGLWLAGNGVACVLLALALAGTENLEMKEAK